MSLRVFFAAFSFVVFFPSRVSFSLFADGSLDAALALGLAYNEMVDLWSVGCVLYELYTGKILFPGKDSNDMLRVILEGTPLRSFFLSFIGDTMGRKTTMGRKDREATEWPDMRTRGGSIGQGTETSCKHREVPQRDDGKHH